MTEAEWLACGDPHLMLQYVRKTRTKPYARRKRLFACACLRFVYHLIEDERSRRAVNAAELFVDGKITRKEVRVVRMEARAAERSRYGTAARMVLDRMPIKAACNASVSIWGAFRETHGQWQEAKAKGDRWQTGVLRDIFGNPFRPAAVNPSWTTWNDGAIGKLTRAIYDDRAFDRLAFLADALKAAGCEDASILDHCRAGGEHVRGCWAVDLLLDKE